MDFSNLNEWYNSQNGDLNNANNQMQQSDRSIAKLLQMAKEAKDFSYSPYSKFAVGCAVLATNHENMTQVFRGANVENASYPCGICAEKTAVGSAVSHGFRRITHIAISGSAPDYIVPCGQCRQFIREFGRNIIIIMGNATGQYKVATLENLLPQSFGPESMGIQSQIMGGGQTQSFGQQALQNFGMPQNQQNFGGGSPF